jgi:phosphoserine phosphatase
MMSSLAAFDMDGTLIQGRLVFALADVFGLSYNIKKIQSAGMAGYEQTKAIAGLFAGLTKKDLEMAIESIPLIRNCEETIAALRDRDYKIGIISDSYTAGANYVSDRLQLDFTAANELEMENGMITGRVGMPLGWDRIGCFCKISVCKRYHLEKFARQHGVPMGKTMAVGDTRFMPKDGEIAKATDKIVQDSNLLKVLEFAA